MQEIVKNNKGNKEKDIVKKQTGITLIALVITIIVLLILAGVSIATLTGNNGILTQANTAKENNKVATAKEKVQLEAAGSFDNTGVFSKTIFKDNLKKNLGLTDSDIVDNADGTITVKIDGYEIKVDGTTGKVSDPSKNNENPTTGVTPGTVVSKTEKNNYKDSENNMATVPQGFTVSGIKEEQTISKGLVIYDIPKSEISNVDWSTAATRYNQFVWIPVASADAYQRDFSYPSYYDNSIDTTPANSTFTDTGYLPSDIQPTTDDATNNETAERNAVLKYNGFYIARYEAGKNDSNVVSKQNAKVYTDKTQEEFKAIGKTMYGDSNNYVKSAMCSGIQWDMVMKFVDGKKDGRENIYDVRTVNSTRHTESKTEAGKNLADKVQNIYDLEGNCYEYVAEKNNTSSPFVSRGGYSYIISGYGASERDSIGGSDHSDVTFRSALYIK